MTALGWFAAALLALCGLPLLLNVKSGDRLFLWLWFWGEFLMLLYVCQAVHLDWPLIANYGFNTALVGAVLWRRS